MTGSTAALTELEGAVLSEIHHRANRTAFQVQRAFQRSPSTEWSGSAGAVYPAIRRLIEGGLITATPMAGGRKAQALEVTRAGVSALTAWACDPGRAAGVGLDPFRLRSGIWRTLPNKERRNALEAVAAEIRQDLARQGADDADTVERTRDELAVRLQRTRLDWIAEELKALG
ncbi:PadR family transcriptional regulator [Sphingomonas cannabina]|uniref:PadR family transcriptional regulator n=1 Tax=Sphingomonas cannabina TaxID=2899123 RepID=UPI001F3FD243|nr:PadR family transcriptional regulator [Sphingomonas cannabina]UIJ44802.1 PadR family transcriptional regulator [Sphingomonas cannabina]